MFQDSNSSKEARAAQAPVARQGERYVFVYGTLRRGGSNDINLRKPAPRYMGMASVQGMLYDLGPYPGLILASPSAFDSSGARSNKVIGEVYAILPALEDNLDELEGLLPVPTGEYFKRFMSLDVTFPADDECGTQPLLCIVYEINPNRTRACASVEGGDWIAHCTEKGAPAATRQREGRDSAE